MDCIPWVGGGGKELDMTERLSLSRSIETRMSLLSYQQVPAEACRHRTTVRSAWSHKKSFLRWERGSSPVCLKGFTLWALPMSWHDVPGKALEVLQQLLVLFNSQNNAAMYYLNFFLHSLTHLFFQRKMWINTNSIEMTFPLWHK